MDPILLPRRVRVVAIVGVLLLLIAAAGALLLPRTSSPAARVEAAPAWIPAVEPNPAHVAHAPKVTVPDGAIGRLSIPSIGVDAVARPVGLTRSGAMDVTPNIWDVGVFDQAVKPGEQGSAVIEGHLDWYTGPAVFWNLHRLSTGDEIDFDSADGATHRFAVSRARTVPYNAAIPDDLYTRTGTPSITLITCSGSWVNSAHSYSTRLLLTATAID
jgi:LPXTG-site transpeptidase (sortase) family protein